MDYINANLTGALSAKELAGEIEKLRLTKQDALKSGINIKTVNRKSIVGEGDLPIKEAVLQKSLAVTNGLGGITPGTVFPAGTSIEAVLREIFKATSDFLMYFGISKEIPEKIDPSFTKEEVIADIRDTGIIQYYTTDDGSEEGNYCVLVYPSNFGTLTHIYYNDLTMFDLISQWDVLPINYGGNSFFMYYSKESTKDINAKYHFIFE